MADAFDSTSYTDDPDSPFIRITRAGGTSTTVTNPRRVSDRPTRVAPPKPKRATFDDEFTNSGEWDDEVTAAFDDEEEEEEVAPKPKRARATATRGARPMPKRLSEEQYEQEQEEIQQAAQQAAAKKTRKPKAAKVAAEPEAEQIKLDLKPAKKKTDEKVKQRQVLGFMCIVASVLIAMAIVSYTPNDAAQAETKISDLPAIFTGTDPIINARADTAQNWLRLIGAMMADFFINKTIGYAAIIYPIFFGMWSLAFFKFTHKQRQRLTLATTFFLCTGILFSATLGTWQTMDVAPHLAREWSGAIGQFLGVTISRLIGSAGALIIYGSLFVITLVFSIDLDIEKTFHRVKNWYLAMLTTSRRKLIEFWDEREAKKAEKERLRELEELEDEEDEVEEVATDTTADVVAEEEEEPEVVEPVKTKAKKQQPKKVEPVAEVSEEPEPIVDEPQAEEKLPVRIMKPLAATGAAALPDLAEAKAQAPQAFTPQTIDPNQPLLKVRPAPKNPDGTPIPRMNRQVSSDRLGDKAAKLARLSNGAIDVPTAEATVLGVSAASTGIVKAAEGIDRTNTTDGTNTTNVTSGAESLGDVDRQPIAEIMNEPPITIESLAPKKPEQKIHIHHEAPVVLGTEKAVSDEVLPHSIDHEYRDVVRDHQQASRAAAKEFDNARMDITNPNLYKDEREGRKVVVPENPYNEILGKYRNPPIDILTPSAPEDELDADDEELAAKGRLLRDKLATFGVEIENITVTPGPVVTLYEFTPAEGIKVSRVENLTDDIALAMKARGIRIIAPMPGRGTIGIEIPNDKPKMVRIRSLFDSPSFKNTKMNLPIALGKTISGDVYVDDLNKMPHLLIAGATGAGKSVGVNGIIASLLYAKSPKDVKFVIVDPKKIELSLYKKIRKHYLIVSPEANEEIVTTPAFAVLALKAVELEMERRYDKLAKAAVRSLVDYNLKVAQGKLHSTQDEQHYHLPYIVVIIDELADLMITAGREIEEPICRIAQMARAVGIHLILATQRPSVDVITGVIKANFPARVAFQVASRVDSRTILDSMGAEQLLGNGDMLYQPSGTPKPIRLQSPFISTEEVEAIIDAVGDQDGPNMSYSRPWTLPSLKSKQGGGSVVDEDDIRDDLFEEAARTIVRHQQGSVSLLQRRLKVGYSRAARIVDELEQAGIVGPFDGSKARQVLCENETELNDVLRELGIVM
jgi:DNA segregation ATPase FtsK/SpoIIIE-like protein